MVFGLQVLAGFDVQDVVLELILPQRGRVNAEVLVNHAHRPGQVMRDGIIRCVAKTSHIGLFARMSIVGQFLNRNGGEEDEFVFQDTEDRKIVVFDKSEGRSIRLNETLIIEGEIDRGLLKTEFNLHQIQPAD